MTLSHPRTHCIEQVGLKTTEVHLPRLPRAGIKGVPLSLTLIHRYLFENKISNQKKGDDDMMLSVLSTIFFTLPPL